jgi:hypothetical protein
MKTNSILRLLSFLLLLVGRQAAADQISLSGMTADQEGVIAWNRTAGNGPEAQRTGHELHWLRGLFGGNLFAEYHLAWPGFDRVFPASTASMHPVAAPVGFPRFTQWMRGRPAAVGQLAFRLDRMDLGNDRLGVDWNYDATNRIETRSYRNGSITVLWAGTPIATAAGIRLDLTLRYSQLAIPQDDEATAVVAPFRLVRTAGAVNADATAVANALLQDIGNSPLRLTIGRIVRTNALPQQARPGFRLDLAGIVLETLAPDHYLDVVGGTVPEGSASQFTIRLSRRSEFPVTFNVATVNGTATAGADYRAVRQAVTLEPGQTSTNIAISTLQDAVDEANETVLLQISQPVNATVRTNNAALGIIDDDGPQIRISPTTVTEGGFWPDRSWPSTPVITRITLGAASPQEIRVGLTARDGTAIASQRNGMADYLMPTNVAVIPPGQVSVLVTNTVIGDWSDETDEHFFLVLTNAVNATIAGTGEAQVTIIDDDGPAMTVFPGNAYEGAAPRGGWIPTNLVFHVGLDQRAAQDVDFTFSITGGTAQAGLDYLRPTQGNALPVVPGQPTRYQFRIPAGQSQVEIEIPVLDDAIAERPESVVGRVADVRNAYLIDASALVVGANPNPIVLGSYSCTAQILDLDAWVVSVGDVTVTETAGDQVVRIPLTLNQTNSFPMWVQFEGVDGTALGDLFPAAGVQARDYAPFSGGVTFQPGQTNVVVEAVVHGNGQAQPDRAFTIRLRSVDFGVAGRSGTVTILDDDRGPAARSGNRTAELATPTGLRIHTTPDGSVELVPPAGKAGARMEWSRDLRNWTDWTDWTSGTVGNRIPADTMEAGMFFRLKE